jgi:two-component system cell cycle sensor histidine kinase/response regulator CckA
MNNQAQPSNHRILIVDDNPSIHEDFRKILCPIRGQAGSSLASLAAELFEDDSQDKPPLVPFQMDSAFQGQEALAKIQEAEQSGNPYSLAFMDVRMPPGWDGVETISRIWKQYPHIQVVICTAYSDYSWAEILKQLGETDNLVILKKPFDNVEVLQISHTLTKKWALSRQVNARLADLDEMVQRRTLELTEANEQLHREIRRRSLMESALRESEERFQKAFEAVPVACVIRPLDTGRYLDVNQCFARLTGYSKEEILDKTPDELNLLVEPETYAALVHSLRSGKRVRDAEVEIRRKDGEHRQTLESIELLRLGEQTCLLAVIEDVTQRKLLEGQLRQAQKMEAVGQLAAGVAHDFNNLLTVIQGYASLQLAKSTLDADVAKAFTHVKLASERASALTRQLLAFSRKQVVQCRPLDLSTTVQKMKSMLGRILGETIQLECPGDSIAFWISADEANLEQVIMNLAVNARDAMPKGGKLSLDISRLQVSAAQANGHPDKSAGQFVVLSVTDTGCGMDPATLSRIFEPFFTTKPIGRGTGLGLSTVYGIIKQHAGWLEVDSRVGRGTTFRVFLPASAAATTPEAQQSDPKPIKAQLAAGETILVVEDEAQVREYMVSALVSHGYAVVQAASGAEALTKWPDHGCNIRLLVTDMIMPGGVSGPMLAQRLMRNSPELRVIYTSGYAPDPGAGGNHHTLVENLNFMPKPFTQERLVQTVRNALNAGRISNKPTTHSPASDSRAPESLGATAAH